MNYKGKRFDPNQTDIETVRCPLCDKSIVLGRAHDCREMLESAEYVCERLGIRLLWTPDKGWCSYWMESGKLIECWTFAEVFNWTHPSRDGQESWFVPVLTTED